MIRLLNHLMRFRWPLAVALLAFLPWSLDAAWRSWLSNSNNVEDWVPQDEQLVRFVDLFGSDELLMISWPGCTLEDPRIAEYAQKLVARNGESPAFFREVITGPRILDFYMAPPLEMPREEALDHMNGWMVSEDGETTCLVALVSRAGAEDRENAVNFARAAASRVTGLVPDEVRMAGPTIEGVAIDQASKSGLLELNLLSYSVCLAILMLCLRSPRAALLVFLLALFNEQLSLALIHWWGVQLDSILLLTANLTFVLSIAIGVHLVNYYRDASSSLSPTEAPIQALCVALRPTLVATATTALGLASLAISEVRPLARFGLFSAVSIALGAIVVMLYTVIHFRIWPLRWARSDEPALSPQATTWFDRLQQFKLPVLILVSLMFLGGAFGVRKLQTAVGLREMVSPRIRSSQDFVWLEERIGPLVPVELVLELPAGDARALLQQFRLVNALHHDLEELSDSNVVISTVTFSPKPPPVGGGFRQRVRAAAFRQALIQNQEELKNLGFLRVEEKSTYWRLSMRAPSMQDVNYGALLSRAQDVMDRSLANFPDIEPRSVLVCGGLPLVHRVQQQLLDDLIHSFLLAFSLVSLALMILFRSVACGLICMIPNLLPSAIVFGIMGWLEWSVEVGAILTASAALGIAVDDSLHFITWFQRKVQQGGSIPDAVRYAYRRCGAAMIQTSLVCSFGLVVFVASDFSPISRFGWCMFTLLLLALVADLVVLPAILLSPLGRPFLPRTCPSNRTSTAGSTSDSGYGATERGESRSNCAKVSTINRWRRKSNLSRIRALLFFLAITFSRECIASDVSSLLSVLPGQTSVAIGVNDYSQAVAANAEANSADDSHQWGDFSARFGLNPRDLAKITRGGLIRAEISVSSQWDEVVVVRVDTQAATSLLDAYRKAHQQASKSVDLGTVYNNPENGSARLVHAMHEDHLVMATSMRAARAILDRLSAAEEHILLEGWDHLELSENQNDTNDFELTWFTVPWLKEQSLFDENGDAKPSQKWKDAQRHGLTGIRSLGGKVDYRNGLPTKSRTAVYAPHPWSATLKMFRHLQPQPDLWLPSWVPSDVDRVEVASMNLPQAFDHIDALFDDFYADGIEGTYQELLQEIRNDLEVDLPLDVYAHMGRQLCLLHTQGRSVAENRTLYAFETNSPKSAAVAVKKLMQDDKEAKQIVINGLDTPMWHVPPDEPGGEDFVFMVAHECILFSNDVNLVRSVLTIDGKHSMAEDSQLQLAFEAILKEENKSPSFLAVRGAEAVEGRSRSPLEMLFFGPTSREVWLNEPSSDFLSTIFPNSEDFQLSVGFPKQNGWWIRSQSLPHKEEKGTYHADNY